MSKAQIIAELPRLSPEERAEVRARLDQLERGAEGSRSANSVAPQIRTPRLADPAQAADFRKHVTELPGNATL